LIGLFDRDVFIKLCCCNLWNEAVQALEITQPYRLVSTNSQKSNDRLIQRKLSNDLFANASERTQLFVDSVPVLPDALVENITSSPVFQRLTNIEGIDSGEQVLSTVMLTAPEDRVLITGDKKFIEAIRKHAPDYWNTHATNFVSFEMCIAKVEQAFGFEIILERAFPVRSCDESLRLAFGAEPKLDQFLEGISSFDPCKKP
jgi:hypothetical protein